MKRYAAVFLCALALALTSAALRAQILQTPDADFLELVKNGRTEEVSRSITRGQSANTSDSSGRTALIYAANGGYIDMIQIGRAHV